MRFSTLNDDTLMRQARDGRFGAFEELVERHQQRLYLFIHRMCGDPRLSALVFSESWAELYRLRGSQAAAAQPTVALFAIAARKLAGRLSVPGWSPPPGAYDEERVSDATDLKWRGARLDEALLALPFKERAALLLCHFDAFKPVDAATCLSEGEENLRMLAGEGLRRLRERLGPDFFGQGLA